VLFIWRLVRWTIGLFTTIVMLAVIYQFAPRGGGHGIRVTRSFGRRPGLVF